MTDGDFTPQQLQAITADDGPLAIVAGPGCGKTTRCDTFPRNHVQHNEAEPLGDGELAGH